MLNIQRQGSIASVLAQLRDIPERVIPYATATALTRTAQAAQKGIVAQMPRAFDRPTRFTLNSTFIKPASVQKLAAQVAVKNVATGGTAPESPMLPEVFGGARNPKRFERALRHAGVLSAGQYAVAGRGAAKDASGNLLRSDIAGAIAAGSAAKGRAGKRRDGYFVAGRRGVFKRVGPNVTSILIFVDQPPQYRTRLDFGAIAEQAAQEHFRAEFGKAVNALLARGGR